jgi:hypothetical protein
MPQRISAAARARRALLFDSLAAVFIAALALSLAAGLGVVGFLGLPILIGILLWIAIERLYRGSRARRSARR